MWFDFFKEPITIGLSSLFLTSLGLIWSIRSHKNQLKNSNFIQKDSLLHDMIKEEISNWKYIQEKKEEFSKKQKKIPKAVTEHIFNYYEYLAILILTNKIDEKMAKKIWQPNILGMYKDFPTEFLKERTELKKLYDKWNTPNLSNHKKISSIKSYFSGIFSKIDYKKECEKRGIKEEDIKKIKKIEQKYELRWALGIFFILVIIMIINGVSGYDILNPFSQGLKNLQYLSLIFGLIASIFFAPNAFSSKEQIALETSTMWGHNEILQESKIKQKYAYQWGIFFLIMSIVIQTIYLGIS